MNLLSPATVAAASTLRQAFDTQPPFRHWVCDGFFDAPIAQRLLAEFPPFERGNAHNEDGALGGKSVVERIRELGPTFAALDDLLQSAAFLQWLSAASGIPDLLYDPWYFGGGTHDNRHGQELDPHIDFNRHPGKGWHRRLNLIVYLNEGWEAHWGGALELHSDPRRADDQISLIPPTFNRCVLFETTEWSWHGFGKIGLPETERQRSRKSIALYFYTKERPAEETAPTHSTVYVDRPLPTHLTEGHRLTDADVQELRVLLTRRDMHIQRLYGEVSTLQQQLEQPASLGPGHLSRLTRGLVELGRARLLERRPLNRTNIKAAMLPFVRNLPPRLREPLRSIWRRVARPGILRPECSDPSAQRVPAPDSPIDASTAAQAQGSSASEAYAQRVAQENAIFAGQADVHDLPAIFHYWSNKYLLPIEREYGFDHPEDFFAKYLLEAANRSGSAKPRFISLGAGNCDAEVRIGQELVKRGLSEFTLECVDINPAMLERGRTLAREADLEGRVLPVAGDFNRWTAGQPYDALMANQSLHHVLELEHLFDAVRAAMKPESLFLVSDIIGRNGHQRWPEALAIVREYWRELPESYRYNRQLNRQEHEFIDWDCSVEGFEGVRAQDILPLLIERFGFELFIGFGNIIDPFIDRSFGHHFDPNREWDRAFIDRVHARDEVELRAGTIFPTHLMAVLQTDRGISGHCSRGMTPRNSLRPAIRPMGE